MCAGGAIARRQIVDLLARLVDKSLVSVTGPRYRLLDTIRQFAAERLDAAAEHDTVAVRHLDWCLALAEEHDPLSAGPRRSLRTLETEHDNLRAGLTFALRRDPQAALRLATSLWRFWLDRGYFVEGERWLEATLVAAPERTALRVEAMLASAGLSLRSGNSLVYLRRVESAVADYRELGDEHATAAALYQHAMLEQSVSNTARADGLFADAVALARRLGDRRLLAAATHASAMTPWYRSDRDQARAVVCEALAILDGLPDDETPFFEVVTFGLCLLDDGPQERPRLHLEETIFAFHRFARAQAIGYALNNLAWATRATGDIARATAALDEALERFRAIEDRRGEAMTLNHMGSLARSQGDFDARPRPPARGARPAPRARREARDPHEHDVAGGAGGQRRRRRAGPGAPRRSVRPRVGRRRPARRWRGCEPTRAWPRSAAANSSAPSRCWMPGASCGACSSCVASRDGRRSRSATCASSSATSSARSGRSRRPANCWPTARTSRPSAIWRQRGR